MDQNSVIPMAFTDELERLFKEEAEKAEVMSILHTYSHIKYNRLSVVVNIPVIIFSSLVGFLSTLDLFDHQNILLGAISLCVATIKTIDSYFDFTKKSESFRLTSLAYAKICKFIQIQLSLDRENRISPDDLLQVITNDLQNLRDAEPTIDKDIIKAFNEKYKDEGGARPPITNGLTQIKIVKTERTPALTPAFPVPRITVVPKQEVKPKINV